MCVCLRNRERLPIKPTSSLHPVSQTPPPIPSPQNPLSCLHPPPLSFPKCRHGNETGCLIHEVNIFPVAGATWVLMHSSVSAKTSQSIVSRSPTAGLPEKRRCSQSAGLSAMIRRQVALRCTVLRCQFYSWPSNRRPESQ